MNWDHYKTLSKTEQLYVDLACELILELKRTASALEKIQSIEETTLDTSVPSRGP